MPNLETFLLRLGGRSLSSFRRLRTLLRILRTNKTVLLRLQQVTIICDKEELGHGRYISYAEGAQGVPARVHNLPQFNSSA
jgi:hypothetical protein